MTLQDLTTASGQTIQDFTIPEELLSSDPELVELIMRSESMNDGERQYWFNLAKVMNGEQIEKLRDILTREKQKLAEIDQKYGKKPAEDPAVALQRAQEKGAQRAEKRASLVAQEQAHEAEEKAKEAEVLAELEAL